LNRLSSAAVRQTRRTIDDALEVSASVATEELLHGRTQYACSTVEISTNPGTDLSQMT
jgi:hypothetical protein